MNRSISALALAATIIGACGSSAATPASPSSPVPTVGPTIEDRSLTAAEEDAERFRQSFGLRSDLEWIRIVAADPTSNRIAFGVPLTGVEVAELYRRTNTLERFRDEVLTYADAQPDYAGSWIDHERGGLLVMQFSGSLLEHRLAILSMAGPGAPIEIRQVRWTLADFERIDAQIGADRDWFETLPAYLYANGQDISANRFFVRVSSAVPDVGQRILGHFGWTADLVVVESDGTGVLLQRPGSLEILALDADGRPIQGLACVVEADQPNVHESRPLPMPRTDEDGTCFIEALPGDYTIQLEVGEAPPTVVSNGTRATIKARKLTRVTIEVG